MRNLVVALALAVSACYAPSGSIKTAPSAPPAQVANQVSLDTVDRVAQSVHRLAGVKADQEFGIYKYACSAWVIARARLMTAAHCGGQQMLVDGEPVKALAIDPYYDLMLLASEKPLGTPLSLRDTRVGRDEWVVGMGYAYGWYKLTHLHAQVKHINLVPSNGMAPGLLVRPGWIGGMSGGPVVDRDGLVVGMVQASNQDLGYGLAAVLVKAFLVGTDTEL